MAKYKIIIQDLEEQKDVINTESDCIMCAFDNDDSTGFVNAVNCDKKTLVRTVVEMFTGVRKAMDQMLDDNGHTYKAALLFANQKDLLGAMFGNDHPEDTDDEG